MRMPASTRNAATSRASTQIGLVENRNSKNNRLSRRTLLLGGLVVSAAFLAASVCPASASSAAMATDVVTFRQKLDEVARSRRFALIDIRADWCTVCHRIEREILTHPSVLQHLQAVPLVKVDVTAMDEGNRELLAHLRASGPPTFFIVDAATGQEYDRTRSVGSFSRRDLVRRLRPFAQAV
jgi:thiol:disulfide interchange protein